MFWKGGGAGGAGGVGHGAKLENVARVLASGKACHVGANVPLLAIDPEGQLGKEIFNLFLQHFSGQREDLGMAGEGAEAGLDGLGVQQDTFAPQVFLNLK